MRTQKVAYMKGGKFLGSLIIVLSISVVILLIVLFKEKNVHLVTAISFMAAAGALVWAGFKLYKPTFTDIIFSEDKIIGKSGMESEEIMINDMEGIWFFTSTPDEIKFNVFSPTNRPSKGSVIIFGKLACFDNASFIKFSGPPFLRDSFLKGYIAINYRKELDGILDYYYSKIKK